MQDDEMYKKLSEYFGSCKKTNELMSDIENEYIELINTEQAQKEYDFLYTRASHDKGNTDVTEGE